MRKIIYILSVLLGLGIFGYYYFVIFDNLSETELINSVLQWYIPFVFGLYGLSAIRIKKKIPTSEKVVKYLFSGKDVVVTVWLLFISLINGLIGVILYIIPLSLFKAKTENYDMNVASTGIILWLIILFLFLEFIFPEL